MSTYESGFLPLENISERDRLRANLDVFEEVDYRVMTLSNNEGDPINLGTLIGFQVMQHMLSGSAIPVVHLDSGKEVMVMGLVLPFWQELYDFLSPLENRERFWKLAKLHQGLSGLDRFSKILDDKE